MNLFKYLLVLLLLFSPLSCEDLTTSPICILYWNICTICKCSCLLHSDLNTVFLGDSYSACPKGTANRPSLQPADLLYCMEVIDLHYSCSVEIIAVKLLSQVVLRSQFLICEESLAFWKQIVHKKHSFYRYVWTQRPAPPHWVSFVRWREVQWLPSSRRKKLHPQRKQKRTRLSTTLGGILSSNARMPPNRVAAVISLFWKMFCKKPEGSRVCFVKKKKKGHFIS